MENFNFLRWLEQSWLVLVACLGGITLIWTFISKTLNEILASFSKPFKDIKDNIEELNKKFDKEAKHNELLDRALLSLQRSSILHSSEVYLKKGFATLEEKETISDQFSSYSELGGNSFVHDMVASVMRLPIEKKTKRKKQLEEE